MVYSRIGFISSQKFKPPLLRNLRQLAIFSVLYFKAPQALLDLKRFKPVKNLNWSESRKENSISLLSLLGST